MEGIGFLRKALEPTKQKNINTLNDIREFLYSEKKSRITAQNLLGKIKKFGERYESLRTNLGNLSILDETEKVRFEEEEEDAMTLILDIDDVQIQLETYLNNIQIENVN